MAYSSKDVRKKREERRNALYSTLLPNFTDASVEALEQSAPKADPRSYGDPLSYLVAAQQNAFHSKSTISVGSPAVRVSKAMAKWEGAESACRLTNARFRKYWNGAQGVFPFAGKHLHAAARRCAEILGPAPDLLSPALHGRHGPGTTWSLRGDLTTLCDKFAEAKPSSSAQLASYLSDRASDFVEQYPLYASCLMGDEDNSMETGTIEFTIADSARLTTVPKTSAIDRVIEVGPTLNMFFQLGVGGFIRRRLSKKTCLRLNTQADVNRYLVRTDGTCATIDSSSASDHVSHNLVVDLLPPEWTSLLDVLRMSAVTTADHEMLYVSKWSGMGNGYTFELETLIFYVLAECVVREHFGEANVDGLVHVFGDDVIVPAVCASDVMKVYEDVGFKINTDKTFVTGPFRESCGVDVFWWDGYPVNVRASYLRAETLSRIEDLYATHNSLARALETLVACTSHDYGTDDLSARSLMARIVRAQQLILSWIPPDKRFYGPDYLGDTVLRVSPTVWRSVGFTPKESKDGLIRIKVWGPFSPRKRLEDYRPSVQMTTAVSGLDFELDTRTSEIDHYLACRGRPNYSAKKIQVVLTPP